MEWKEYLQKEVKLAPSTINAKIASINAFFKFADWEEYKIKSLRLQRKVFRDRSRNLTKEEYQRLIDTASAHGNERLALIMETICSTGIRVSEVKYITAEAVKNGQSVISLKGKIRTILLPGKLCKKLKKTSEKRKSLPVRFFLPEAEKVFHGVKYGRK